MYTSKGISETCNTVSPLVNESEEDKISSPEKQSINMNRVLLSAKSYFMTDNETMRSLACIHIVSCSCFDVVTTSSCT